jgi:hypothetical protein
MRDVAPGVEVHILRPGEEMVIDRPRAGSR